MLTVRSAVEVADHAYREYSAAMKLWQDCLRKGDWEGAEVARLSVITSVEDYLDHTTIAYKSLPREHRR